MADEGRAWRAGLPLAMSVLTRFPCKPSRTDPAAAGWAMAWGPLVGAAVGGIASVVFTLARLPLGPYAPRLLPAVLAVAAIALVTGALHLDGLADSADALGVRGDTAAVRAAMKSPGVGAFGVVALILTLVVDIAAVSTAASRGFAVVSLVTGSVAGRLAVTWSCRPGVAAADPGTGLGAWVAGSVPLRRAIAATASAAVLVGAWAALWHRHHPVRAVLIAYAALAAGLLTGEALRRLVTRHVGGLTGDILGAVVECSSMAAYIVVALAA
jgi:adenosylcobinamide-GDP ribazoletransferase